MTAMVRAGQGGGGPRLMEDVIVWDNYVHREKLKSGAYESKKAKDELLLDTDLGSAEHAVRVRLDKVYAIQNTEPLHPDRLRTRRA
eukprot:SAG22_NODE_2477_length_2530_cov_1.385027_1_plen_85_part_10